MAPTFLSLACRGSRTPRSTRRRRRSRRRARRRTQVGRSAFAPRGGAALIAGASPALYPTGKPSSNYADLEAEPYRASNVYDCSAAIKAAFIRKVYTILRRPSPPAPLHPLFLGPAAPGLQSGVLR